MTCTPIEVGEEDIELETTPMQIDASIVGGMDTMPKIVGKSMMGTITKVKATMLTPQPI